MNARRLRRTPLALALAVALALPASGCVSTTYQRGDRRLISMAMSNGQLVYERDGRAYDANLFGSGLEMAVQGNPTAVEYARAGRESMWAFLGTYLGGAGLMLAGAAISGVSAVEGGSLNDPGMLTGLGLLGVGTIGLFGSIYFAMRGQAAQLDAITAYNDGVILDLQRRLDGQTVPAPASPSFPQDRDETPHPAAASPH